MIQNAVFVLGAGASCPYGFPTGKDLREQILSKYASNCEAYLRTKERGKPLIPQEVRLARDFAEKFRKSSTKSIDLFLARNPEHSRAGKRAIIFRILDAERASGFREKARYRNQDWYAWLFEQMTDELVQKEDYSRFSENDVSFITFNYDRSLEHFLYDSLINSFNGIPEDKITEQLNRIEICHVFGQVGPLEWQGQYSETEYRASFSNINVDALCDNIKIVHEKGENPKLGEAQELIGKAHRVFFLGFGYAEENLDVLGIPEVLEEVQQVFGTAMGFTKREITGVESLFEGIGIDKKKSVNIHRSVSIEDLDCLALLRKYL